MGLSTSDVGESRGNVHIQLVLCPSPVSSDCLSNRQFERLGGPLDEIVTVFVAHIQRHNTTSSCTMMS